MLFFSVFNQFYVIFNHFFKLPVPSNYYRIVYLLYYSFMVANLKRKNIFYMLNKKNFGSATLKKIDGVTLKKCV